MIRAELTKFRTAPGWVAGLVAVVVLFVGLGLLLASGSHTSCGNVACQPPPVGPEGQAVDDRFSFAHQTLDGDGTLTAHVKAFTGVITYPPPGHDELVEGLAPWAKAGLMVKDGTKPGSAYAAVMLTGHRGVRLQHNYVHDLAGPADARWLRLDRKGHDLTAYASTDGTTWQKVGAVTLPELSSQVQIGFLVASPSDVTATKNATGGSIVQGRFTQATAAFDQIESTTKGAWQYDEMGRTDDLRTDWEKNHRAAGLELKDGVLTLTGSGDIAPASGLATVPYLAGSAPALLIILVVAVLFMTSEFRRGLIRVTLLARPDRGRVLATKAAVVGGVVFAATLVAVLIARPLVGHVFRANGNFDIPTSLTTDLRLTVGTAVFLAMMAVLAYALGALFRRGLPAILLAVLLTVLPYLLATGSFLPVGASQWLLRLTPAAGFAMNQTLPAYAQVLVPYTPADGYYPLPPLAGLGVTAAWAAVILTVAIMRFRKADV